MSASYEFWLTDDAGIRITLLKNYSYASYSRSTRGYGIIQLGIPLEEYLAFVPVLFQPDWRIDVYRSPEQGIPKRREGSYFLRKFRIYDRETDAVRMIQFFGRSPIDILRRWSVCLDFGGSPHVVTDYKTTDYIDDMMKSLVNRLFITGGNVAPAGEFSVDGDTSLGPIITRSYLGKNILDVLTDLKATSFSLNQEDSTNRKIYFDCVEGPGKVNGFGYIFRTFANIRGVDRTKSLVFSMENGNMRTPEYYEDYLDQSTIVQVGTTTVTSPDSTLSRWNNILKYKNHNPTDTGDETSMANQILNEEKKDISMGAYFLSNSGSSNQPRSLYGVDWDLGDLLPVNYAGKNMNVEVEIVWVSIDEIGRENIVGSNRVGV